jgi:TRAP-type C4-dicarboxylate transport system permease small subunit
MRIERIFLYVSGIFFMAMMFLGAGDVLGRYFFNTPIRGTLEISSIVMGAIVFLNWGLTQRNEGHVKVELLMSRYSDRQKMIARFFTLLMSLVLFVLCSYKSAQIAITCYQQSRVFPTLGIPTAPFYALVPIGAALMSVEIILQIVGVVVSIRKG